MFCLWVGYCKRVNEDTSQSTALFNNADDSSVMTNKDDNDDDGDAQCTCKTDNFHSVHCRPPAPPHVDEDEDDNDDNDDFDHLLSPMLLPNIDEK